MTTPSKKLVAVLSDTHGEVPGWVLELFWDQHVCGIIHAGDIVGEMVVRDLQAIAPLTFVRGNMDPSSAGSASAVAECCDMCAYVIHSLDQLDLDPVAAGMQVVISGHTHVPKIEWRGGVLYLNPGSASHPRYGNPPSVALIELDNGVLRPTIWFKDQGGQVRPATES